MSGLSDLKPDAQDLALDEVADFFRQKPGLQHLVAKSLRKAFDEVIDGPRTGRFRIEQLEKTEKTYIGTKVEIVIRSELELERGRVLDNLICGHEVDTKFSLKGAWMIPREAVGQLCLVIKASDNSGIFSVGLIRAEQAVLTTGANQDGKKSLSAAGKQRIHWLIARANMQANVLLALTDENRNRILSPSSGMQRVRELFLAVNDRFIPREVVAQVAQQKDPMRRARQMKAKLLEEGLVVLCATYEADRVRAAELGFPEFDGDDWLVTSGKLR